MSTFLGAINTNKIYRVSFYHKRNDELEYEEVEAKSEAEAIKKATIKHRKTYKGQQFKIFKIK